MSSTNMSTASKVLLAFAVVAGGFGLAAFFGFTPFLKVITEVQQMVGTSANGSTFSTSKDYSVVVTPTNNATSTSILNTDASDRYITSNFVDCGNATTSYTAVTGTGLANITVKAATTSTNAPAVIANTNLAMNDTIATGTSAQGTAGFIDVVVSSSSVSSAPTVTGNAGANSFQFRWAAGSYLTFFWNATSTMTCTIGVHTIAS